MVCQNNRSAERHKLVKYDLDPSGYELEQGRVHIPCPPLALNKNTGSTFAYGPEKFNILCKIPKPAFLAHKFDLLISDTAQAELLARWSRFMKINPTAHNSGEASSARSTSAKSFHFGVWRRSSKQTFITKDTICQNEEQRKRLDEFLALVKDYVGVPVRSLMKRYANEEWEMRKVMWKHIKEKGIIQGRPVLDFNEAFTTLAVTNGVSDVVHTDRNDAGITWVFPIGKWEGGDMCLNQTERIIQVNPGDGIALQASFLAHRSTCLESGSRMALTCFVDHIDNTFLDAFE